MLLSTVVMDPEAYEISAVDNLAQLLVRIGAELEDVAGRLGRLTIAGGPPGHGSGLSARELTSLQDIDLAHQVLQSVAVVIRRAALSDAAAHPIDVERLAEGLPLESMTRLVTGRADQRVVGGELDLF